MGDGEVVGEVGGDGVNPTEEAIFYITNWYPCIGAGDTRTQIQGLSSPYHVMNKAADEMIQSKPSDAFPDRHKEHIAYALKMVASGGLSLSDFQVPSAFNRPESTRK